MNKFSNILYNSAKNQGIKMTRAESDRVAAQFLDELKAEIATHGKFSVTRFGTFRVR